MSGLNTYIQRGIMQLMPKTKSDSPMNQKDQ